MGFECRPQREHLPDVNNLTELVTRLTGNRPDGAFDGGSVEIDLSSVEVHRLEELIGYQRGSRSQTNPLARQWQSLRVSISSLQVGYGPVLTHESLRGIRANHQITGDTDQAARMRTAVLIESAAVLLEIMGAQRVCTADDLVNGALPVFSDEGCRQAPLPLCFPDGSILEEREGGWLVRTWPNGSQIVVGPNTEAYAVDGDGTRHDLTALSFDVDDSYSSDGSFIDWRSIALGAGIGLVFVGGVAGVNYLRTRRSASAGPSSSVPSLPGPALPENPLARDRLIFEVNPEREYRVMLGREGVGDNFVQLANLPEDNARQYISSQHAELSINQGVYEIRDLGSLNGTRILRHDPVRDRMETISVGDHSVTLREGDVVRFSHADYQVEMHANELVLQRTDSLNGPVSVQTLSVDVSHIGQERPIRERLEAARGRGLMEVFASGTKDKYVGEVVRVDGDHLVLRQENNGEILVNVEDILTIRGRGTADNLSNRYFSVSNPQYGDKSININGPYQVLVDLADPRLTTFLEDHMTPIREQLRAGQITQQQAARSAWKFIRNYVPYDHALLELIEQNRTPNQLFRLGDFIQTGICNERGLLLQVSLQHIGVESELAAGTWGGPDGRHAWVEATFEGRDGRPVRLLLDPQNPRVLDLDSDSRRVRDYVRNHSAHKVDPRVMTIAIRGFNQETMGRLIREGMTTNQILLLQTRSYDGRDLFDWADIEQERMRSLDFRLNYEDMHFDSMGSRFGHGRVIMQFVHYAPYDSLSDGAKDRELRIALEVYEDLTTEERNRFWERSGGRRTASFPESFVEAYRNQRRRLHEEGRHRFGETDRVRQAMVSEMRIVLSSELQTQSIPVSQLLEDHRRSEASPDRMALSGFEELSQEARRIPHEAVLAYVEDHGLQVDGMRNIEEIRLNLPDLDTLREAMGEGTFDVLLNEHGSVTAENAPRLVARALIQDIDDRNIEAGGEPLSELEREVRITELHERMQEHRTGRIPATGEVIRPSETREERRERHERRRAELRRLETERRARIR